MFVVKSVVPLLLSLAVPFVSVADPSVTLAWNPSPAPGIAGYRLYEGLASQNYTTVETLGLITSATASGLLPSTTYYFAVTAFDTNGLESPYSGEISFTTQGTLLAELQVTVGANGQVILSGTAPAGYAYDVQALQTPVSPAAADWTVIGSLISDTNGTFQFADPDWATNEVRLYRLHQTYP